MIIRCYDKKNKKYKNYGELGIVVCDKWLCFENYIEDVKKLKGYDEELIIKNHLQLDKDINSINKKIYSPENCMWISKYDNLKERDDRRNKWFKASRLSDGLEVISNNQRKFSRDYNISHISCILNGKRNMPKDWNIRFIDISGDKI